MQTKPLNALACAMGAALLFAVHLPTHAALPTYTCTLLESSAPGGSVNPTSVDRRAFVYGATDYVGWSGPRATQWSRGVPKKLRERTSSTGSAVLGVSDGGYWAGYAMDELGVARPVRWKDETPLYLRLLSSNAYRGMAHHVNKSGQSVGFNDMLVPEHHAQAVTWKDGQIFILPALASQQDDGGVNDSQALAINDYGLMVGWSQKASDGDAVPVRWTSGRTVYELDLLPGHTGGMARSVNKDKVIVGETHAYDSGYSIRAVAWHEKETRDLGALPDHVNSMAMAVDSVGHVVGWSESANGESRAVWWPSWMGAPLDLNTRLDTTGCRDASNHPLVLTSAVALGELGVIAATARQGNDTLGFMLKPI